MSGSKSDAWENLLLDYLMAGTPINLPGTIWIGLWTAALSDTSTAATAGEVSGGGYARYAVTRNNANWNAASGGTLDNKVAYSFGTASADWGTVTHMALCGTPSGAGTIFYWADLTAQKIIQNGDPVQINVGDLDISEA